MTGNQPAPLYLALLADHPFTGERHFEGISLFVPRISMSGNGHALPLSRSFHGIYPATLDWPERLLVSILLTSAAPVSCSYDQTRERRQHM